MAGLASLSKSNKDLAIRKNDRLIPKMYIVTKTFNTCKLNSIMHHKEPFT